MKNRTLLRAFGALIFLSIAGNGLAMQGNFAQKAAQFGKKAFRGTCTAIGWGIAAGPFWGRAAYSNVSDETKANHSSKLVGWSHEPITNPTLKEFCNDALAAVDVNPKTITIISSDEHMSEDEKKVYLLLKQAHAGHNSIYLQAPYLQEIEHLLEQKKEIQQIPEKKRTQEIRNEETAIQCKLDEWRAVLHHEATHVKNHDIRTASVVAFATPLITHYGIKFLHGASDTLSTIGHLKKIPAGIAKGIINLAVLNQYRQYQEQRADDGIQQDKNILQAAVRDHQLPAFVEQEKKKQISQALSNLPTSVTDILTPIVNEGVNLLTSEHPSVQSRIAKFEQRIAQIEAQETAAKKS